MHNHEGDHKNCGCGCNAESENDTIILTLDDDSEVECEVIGIFDALDKEYIALLPIGDETVLIYEYQEKEDEMELKLIEDDGEFQQVSDVFYQLIEEEDGDES